MLEGAEIWITGGSGFIGSNICKILTKKPIKNLICFENKRVAEPSILRLDHRVNQVLLDFGNSQHLKWLRDTPTFTKPNYLLLVGWGSTGNPDLNLHQTENVASVVEFFEAVPKTSLRKVIFFGSIDEYGRRLGQINENDIPLPPFTSYAIGKAVAGKKLAELASKHKVSFQHCQISNVYGPGQREETLLPQIRKASSFKFSGESYFRDYIFVDDLINIVSVLLISDISSRVNIGSGISTHCFDFVRIAWDLMGKDPQKLSFTHPEIRDESLKKCFDISRLNEMVPRTLTINSVESGIRQTVSKL